MGALEDMAVGIDNLRQVSLRMEELPSGSCMGGTILYLNLYVFVKFVSVSVSVSLSICVCVSVCDI